MATHAAAWAARSLMNIGPVVRLTGERRGTHCFLSKQRIRKLSGFVSFFKRYGFWSLLDRQMSLEFLVY